MQLETSEEVIQDSIIILFIIIIKKMIRHKLVN